MKLNKRISAIFAALALTALGVFSMAGSANAAGESATVGFKLDPQSGSFFKEANKPGNLSIETTIDTAAATVLPMKTAKLQLPSSNNVTFNPGNMAVCSDSDIGPPPTNVSITVPEAVAKCPNSVIGNGTAKFALAQQTALPRDGAIVLFNGGNQASGPLKGQPRVKLYAYSYDTGVGLYAEATLAKDGSLDFEIPQLTADSSVTAINLNMPGSVIPLRVESQDITVNIPAGQNKGYVQAKCTGSSFAFSGEFLLGTRDTLGNPTSPTTTLTASDTHPCSGAAGKAKFANLKIKGPASVKKGKKGTYKVTVKNAGTATAKSGKLAVSGKGVKGKASFGSIAPGKSKTVKVKVKFTKKGKVKAKFKATAAKTAAKTATKSVKVK